MLNQINPFLNKEDEIIGKKMQSIDAQKCFLFFQLAPHYRIKGNLFFDSKCTLLVVEKLQFRLLQELQKNYSLTT